jgi:hypothetical protein
LENIAEVLPGRKALKPVVDETICKAASATFSVFCFLGPVRFCLTCSILCCSFFPLILLLARLLGAVARLAIVSLFETKDANACQYVINKQTL